MKKSLLAILLAISFFQVEAKEAVPNEDPAIEDRFKAISSELRCLKCQNQTIFDSKAGLADDLRRQIRSQINTGKSNDEIVDYMVARYGDFIRYRPALKPENILLWVGPFLLMIIGFITLIVQLKKRRALISDAPLSADELAKVNTIIKDKSGE
ncbi:MAG: cytochrome c-type biogenesis protein CcmH [Gammaproteobacteria bacterium]|nr:cytochrome c-type biogenesis protein CcmH [Gammaproteobacteria bacterium]MDH5731345.1 cytochrome c-type biogenesis protein CcmH [Gammaproteobacteria bacterium]